MLTALDMEIVAFDHVESAEWICRACAVKKLGEHCVAKMEVGLVKPDGWDTASRYQVDESATERAYECAGTFVGEEDHPRNDDGYCPLCDEELCFGCGALLSTPVPVQANAESPTATPSGGAEGVAHEPKAAGPCMSTEEKSGGG